MIVAYIQFPTGGASAEKMADLMKGSAPKYAAMSGLIRKYYLLSEDASMAGGVYLWDSKAEAETVYNNQWRAFIKDRYGAEPVIVYFECPVVVDNLSSEILTANEIKKVA